MKVTGCSSAGWIVARGVGGTVQRPPLGPHLALHPVVLALAHRAGVPKTGSRASVGVGGSPLNAGRTEEPALSPGGSDSGTLSCFQQWAKRAGAAREHRGRSCPNAAHQACVPAPNPARGLREQLPARGCREKGLQGEGDCWLGPAATGVGRRECAPASASLREDLTLPHPRDFRSSITDPGEFLPGLKGIT